MSEVYDYESVTVANTAIGLTASKLSPSSSKQASRLVITLDTAQIRYRMDGTDPTTSEGHILDIGDTLVIEDDFIAMSNFKAIRTGSTSGKLRISYER